jgi:hypothetical protein
MYGCIMDVSWMMHDDVRNVLYVDDDVICKI